MATSTSIRGRRASLANLDHASSGGATIKVPTASPSHHTPHSVPKADHGWTPPRHRLATPMVAAAIGPRPAPSTVSPTASRSRSSSGRKPAHDCSSQAPATASSVLPRAMPHAVRRGSPEVALVSKAPSVTAGQRR